MVDGAMFVKVYQYKMGLGSALFWSISGSARPASTVSYKDNTSAVRWGGSVCWVHNYLKHSWIQSRVMACFVSWKSL